MVFVGPTLGNSELAKRAHGKEWGPCFSSLGCEGPHTLRDWGKPNPLSGFSFFSFKIMLVMIMPLTVLTCQSVLVCKNSL